MIECGKGKIIRKSFIRNGKAISAKCIRKTTIYEGKREEFTIPEQTKRLRGSRRSNITCRSGEILRKSYVRITKSGKRVFVKEGCIPDLGLLGKRTEPGGIGILRKGELTQFGYRVKNSVQERHKALVQAIRYFGSLGVWRKLNAIYVYTKNTNPLFSSIYNDDRNWVRNKYGLKAF